jgi:hypothetical protein
MLAKILDFGLAKLTRHDREKQSLTAVGDVFGSPFYMSPEQCRGERLDRSSDAYSVGCAMFECLTGQPPFNSNVVSAVIFSQLESDAPALADIVGKGKFPDAMEIVMAKLLRKNPVERYQSLLELRTDLEKVKAGEAVEPFYVSRTIRDNQVEKPADKQSTKTASETEGKRIQTVAIATAFSLLVILAVSAAFLISNQRRASLQKEQSLSPVITASKPIAAEETAPYSTLIQKNGRTCKLFKFPEDVSIGSLEIGSATDIEAKGELAIPEKEQLTFSPALIAFQHPNYLRRFRPGEIECVDLTLLKAPQNKTDSNLTADKYLEILGLLPGVRSIKLDLDELPMRATALTALQKFDSLSVLTIESKNLDTEVIANLSNLKKLTFLELYTASDVKPILMRLRQSPNLTTLKVLGSDLRLEEIEYITDMPKLRALHATGLSPKNSSTTTKALQLLSKAPALTTICINDLPLSMQALPVMQQFERSIELRFNFPAEEKERKVISALQQNLPKMHFSNVYIERAGFK